MLLQVWRHQVVEAALTQVVGEEIRTRMNLNGHAAVQEWQIVCANVKKDFTDKLTIKKHESWELENQKSHHQ